MQSQLSSSRVLTVFVAAAAVSVASMTTGPAVVSAASVTAVTVAAVSQVPSASGAVVTVPPSRLADSRTAQQISGPLPALGTAAVQVTGNAGVPQSGVAAAVITVTAVSPQTAGWLTVSPSGNTRPTTSNLNFQAGQTIANTVIVPLGPDGKIRLFNGSGGTTDLLVDINGYTLSDSSASVARTYPWHTGIVSTTFWVGEIFDPNASDGSQMYSTYDDDWYTHFGGCDGITSNGCQTERRTATNGYFPTRMVPHENPFYLDLPFDDVNNSAAFVQRAQVIPWAGDPGYAGHAKDRSFSYMKNRWVQINKGGKTCYGQVEDAGPGQYNDANFVFGAADARPLNRRYNAAGLDVSPALNGCLGYSSLDGDADVVSWRFVEAAALPSGPWTTVITASGLNNH